MFDLAIVGGGPAGMAAAVVAAEHGATVIVVDEQRYPGGQIFRQPPEEFTDTKLKYSAGYRWGRDLVANSAQHPRIDWACSTSAFGILRNHDEHGQDNHLVLATQGPEGAKTIECRRLLIATGAYDLPVAFPGWTLPGVMMAGAVQSLIKSQRLLTAQRLVLAGAHPLLIVVGDQLRAAGADVAEISFARALPNLREATGALRAVPGHLGLLRETALALARLKRSGTRISPQTIVTKASGTDHVTHVDLSPVDKKWRVSGASRRVETTSLILGYGFQPSTDLARQIRCDLHWDSAKGGWVVSHDNRMRTTSPGIFVAGEPAGVAGAAQARADGHLAGLAIVEDLELGSSAENNKHISAARRKVRKEMHFSRVVQTMFQPEREGLAALATPETILCRCELVTQADVGATLVNNPFMSTVSAVKLECRTGMGPCQGRYCEASVVTQVAIARQRPMHQVGYFAAHLPVKPVPVRSLAALDRGALDQ